MLLLLLLLADVFSSLHLIFVWSDCADRQTSRGFTCTIPFDTCAFIIIHLVFAYFKIHINISLSASNVHWTTRIETRKQQTPPHRTYYCTLYNFMSYCLDIYYTFIVLSLSHSYRSIDAAVFSRLFVPHTDRLDKCVYWILVHFGGIVFICIQLELADWSFCYTFWNSEYARRAAENATPPFNWRTMQKTRSHCFCKML